MPILDYQPKDPPKRKLRPMGPFDWISLAFFLTSLAFPGFHTDRNDNAWSPSVSLFLCGCFNIGSGGNSWLANPLVLTSWYLLRARTSILLPSIAAALALCFALSFLFETSIVVDEAGSAGTHHFYGPGYWLWTASILAALLACLHARHKQRTTPAEP